MKAAYIRVPLKIEYHKLTIPPIGPEEVLVKVSACGICGSDLHLGQTLAKEGALPLGHEFSGIIKQTGAAVHNIRPGDMVAVESNTSLGTSKAAKNGFPHNCTDLYITFEQSCMAEYVKTHYRAVHLLKGLTAVEGALDEPLIVALDLVETGGDIPLEGNIAIFGGGPIGLMALAIARLRGANKTFLTQPSHSLARIALAEKIGCDRIIRIDKEDPGDVLKKECPEGLDRIFVTAPPSTIPLAFEVAGYGGIVCFNGIDYEHPNINFDSNAFHFKRLQLRASHNFPNLRAPLAIDLLQSKKINASDYISHIFDFTELQKAITTAAFDKESSIKVVVTIN